VMAIYDVVTKRLRAHQTQRSRRRQLLFGRQSQRGDTELGVNAARGHGLTETEKEKSLPLNTPYLGLP